MRYWIGSGPYGEETSPLEASAYLFQLLRNFTLPEGCYLSLGVPDDSQPLQLLVCLECNPELVAHQEFVDKIVDGMEYWDDLARLELGINRRTDAVSLATTPN